MKKINLLVFIALLGISSCSVHKNIARTNTQTVNAGFLLISDVHLNTYSDSTSYGYDTGMELWKIFLAKVDSLLNSINAPGFVVYTGDLPAHYSCTNGCYLPPDKRETHNRDLATILSGLRDLTARHHTPLFYLPGNNDGLAGDYYSFADENKNTPLSLIPETVNPYPALNINQSGTIAPCMVSNTHPSMGYYSAKPIGGLRIIALNTSIFSKNFIPVDGSSQLDEGDEQIKWLSAELKDAAEKGDKVYIAMHIPPGVDAYAYKKHPDNAGMWVRLPGQQKSWQDRFLAIVAQNQNTIAGILYGHTHMDEVRRLYDSTGTHITAVAISCPGVTPQHFNNPGFKVVQYDKQSKELTDFTTYYTKPSASLSWGDKAYSFNSVFSFPAGNTLYKNLRTASIADISKSMNKIYTVMNGPVPYNIQSGIEVRFGQ